MTDLLVTIPAENRLPNGRVVVWSVTTGGRYERLEDQARTLLNTGLFRFEQFPASEPAAASPTIGASGESPAVSVAPRRRGRK